MFLQFVQLTCQDQEKAIISPVYHPKPAALRAERSC